MVDTNGALDDGEGEGSERMEVLLAHSEVVVETSGNGFGQQMSVSQVVDELEVVLVGVEGVHLCESPGGISGLDLGGLVLGGLRSIHSECHFFSVFLMVDPSSVFRDLSSDWVDDSVTEDFGDIESDTERELESRIGGSEVVGDEDNGSVSVHAVVDDWELEGLEVTVVDVVKIPLDGGIFAQRLACLGSNQLGEVSSYGGSGQEVIDVGDLGQGLRLSSRQWVSSVEEIISPDGVGVLLELVDGVKIGLHLESRQE